MDKSPAKYPQPMRSVLPILSLILSVLGIVVATYLTLLDIGNAPNVSPSPTPSIILSSNTATATPNLTLTSVPSHTPSHVALSTVTATPTDLPIPTKTSIPRSTAQRTATRTPTPRLEPSPILESASRISGNAFLFRWSWTRELASDEFFDVRFWLADQLEEPSLVWTKDPQYILDVSTTPNGSYFWRVVVVRDFPPPGSEDGSWQLLAKSSAQFIELPGINLSTLPPRLPP